MKFFITKPKNEKPLIADENLSASVDTRTNSHWKIRIIPYLGQWQLPCCSLLRIKATYQSILPTTTIIQITAHSHHKTPQTTTTKQPQHNTIISNHRTTHHRRVWLNIVTNHRLQNQSLYLYTPGEPQGKTDRSVYHGIKICTLLCFRCYFIL